MDNIKDALTNVSRSVYKTSKGFIKSTKLSLSLSGEESNLKELYLEIGKKVHEIYAYGGSLGKFFDEKYKELVECEQRIDALRKELDVSKGTRTCSKCGKTAALSAEFCPKCGARLADTPEHAGAVIVANEPRETLPQAGAEAEPVPAVSAGTIKLCSVCGKENPESSKFCFSCGRML